MPTFPFEVSLEEILRDPESYVDAVFSCLESEFLVMPKGAGFSEPISIVILRSMLGFTSPEWGYVTTQRTGISVTQGFVRSLDRKVRMNPETELNTNGVTRERLKAMVKTRMPAIGDRYSRSG